MGYGACREKCKFECDCLPVLTGTSLVLVSAGFVVTATLYFSFYFFIFFFLSFTPFLPSFFTPSLPLLINSSLPPPPVQFSSFLFQLWHSYLFIVSFSVSFCSYLLFLFFCFLCLYCNFFPRLLVEYSAVTQAFLLC